MFYRKLFAGVAAFAAALALVPMTTFAQATSHGEGANIAASDGTTYMISGGKRRPYTSAGAFLSYGFNSWGSVVPESDGDRYLPIGSFIPPQDGKIICSDRHSDKGTCYVISGTLKAGFVSEQVFAAQGYSFANALYGDVSWMYADYPIASGASAHKPGTLINRAGTIYLVVDTGLMGIPSMNAFYSWGYALPQVVPANTADASKAQVAIMQNRLPGQLNPREAFTGTVSAKESPLRSTAQLVLGQSDQEVFRVTLSAAANAPLTVEGLGIDFVGDIDMNSIKNVKIFRADNMQQVGSNSGNVVGTGVMSMYFMDPRITISAGTSIDFIVKVQVSPSASGRALGAKLHSIYYISDSGQVVLLQDGTGFPVYGIQHSVQSLNVGYILNIETPSPGEKVVYGSQYPLIWTSTGLSAGARVSRITVKRASMGGDGTVRTLYSNPAGLPTAGKITWNVDESYTAANDYYIEMEILPGSETFGTYTTATQAFFIGPFSYQ